MIKIVVAPATNKYFPACWLISHALSCKYVIKDDQGDLNCLYFEDAPGYCSPEFCPLNGKRR